MYNVIGRPVWLPPVKFDSRVLNDSITAYHAKIITRHTLIYQVMPYIP